MTKKQTINPVVAGVAGAVVGAGVGAAGAIALGDKKNRAQVEKVVKSVRKKAMDYVEAMDKPKNMKASATTVKKIVKKAVAATPLNAKGLSAQSSKKSSTKSGSATKKSSPRMSASN